MSLIRKFNELEISRYLKILLYGQAGMGKSTLGISAPKPLLIDFDGGAKRINKAHLHDVGIVQVGSWSEAMNVLNENLSAFDTIVVDTLGKMMDFIIEHKCPGRVPRINDWNGINAEFGTFTRKLSSLQKHQVFICHRDTRKEGDDTVFIPALREKNYNSIVTELDLLGYMEVREKRWTVTFDPTNRNDGKNTCNLPSVINIPMIVDANGNPIKKNTALQDMVIAPYMKRLDDRDAETEKYNQVVAEIKENIELITDAISAKDFASRIKNFAHIGNSVAVARDLFGAKLNELKLKYNKDTDEYEPAA